MSTCVRNVPNVEVRFLFSLSCSFPVFVLDFLPLTLALVFVLQVAAMGGP